jgi:c-di-GMP-binding flagellar brake protein YcgR
MTDYRFSNRRRTDRVPITIAVKKKIGRRVFVCQASDISAEGIFLASVLEELHSPDARCLLEFTLPGSRTTISAHGRVVRQLANGRYHLTAVKFSTIAPSHRRLIHRYVKNPSQRVPGSTPFLEPRRAA